jgi:ankyrin repeat protein
MEMTMLLLRKGSDINARDGDENTPLLCACCNGHVELARTILDLGGKIEAKDGKCWTGLHFACDKNYFKLAAMLVKRGVDLNAEDHKQGKTALHMCAEKGFHELGEYLVLQGADLYASGDYLYSKTPLHLACIHGQVVCTAMLVKRGSDIEAFSGLLDKTPLHFATEAGHLECCEILVRAGADVNAQGSHVNGNTALHIAAMQGHTDIAEMLVTVGKADIEAVGKFTVKGMPLHIACQYGHVETVEKLILLGAEINQKAKPTLYTPLHVACEHEKYQVALLLIKLNGDMEAKTLTGQVPMDLARDHLMKDEMRLASIAAEAERQRLAKIAAIKAAEEAREAQRRKEAEELRKRLEEEERQRKARLAARFLDELRVIADVSGELAAMTALVDEFVHDTDQNINVIIIPEMQCTALIRAAYRGFEDIVAALLLWPGINLNIQDQLGNTALHEAADRGHRSIVEQLLLSGAKTAIANRQGLIAASVTKSGFLREIIRNPSLIESRTRTQLAVYSAMITSHINMPHEKPVKILPRIESADATCVASSNSVVAGVSPAKSPLVSKMRDMVSTWTDQLTNQLLDDGERPHRLQASLVSSVREGIISPSPAIAARTAAWLSKEHLGEPQSALPEADTAEFTRGRFGSVPLTFGGCRADLFFVEAKRQKTKEQQRHIDAVKRSLPDPLPGAYLPEDDTSRMDLNALEQLQASFCPTAFDSTEEFHEVKDFLWLLGRPYKHFKHSSMYRRGGSTTADSFAGYGLQADDEDDNEEEVHPFDGNSLQSGSVGFGFGLGLAGGEPSLELDAPSRLTTMTSDIDKRSYLYRVARLLDQVQSIYTDSATLSSLPWQSPTSPAHAVDATTASTTTKEAPVEQDKTSSASSAGAIQRVDTATSISAWGFDTGSKTYAEYYGQMLSDLCTAFVRSVTSIFEPMEGWPMKSDGLRSNLWERVGLLRYGGLISQDVQGMLFKLLEMGGFVDTAEPPRRLLSTGQIIRPKKKTAKQIAAAQKRKEELRSIRRVFSVRQRRLMVDYMYEVAFAMKERAETAFPVGQSSIRFHLLLGFIDVSYAHIYMHVFPITMTTIGIES